MSNSQVKIGPMSSWSLTADSWDGFLRWLDDGNDSGGQSYMEMRRRLVAYFDRKNCRNPDDLADETLDRVARRLEEERTIETETPAKYCYTVARFVFMESLRSKESKSDPIDEISRIDELKITTTGQNDEHEEKEKMLDCLDKCSSSELETRNRELIFRYYERHDVAPHKKYSDYYINPAERFLPLGTRRFRAHRTDEKTVYASRTFCRQARTAMRQQIQ